MECNNIYSYCSSLEQKNSGTFEFTHKGNATLLSTSFTISLIALLNKLDEIKNKDHTIHFINNQQDSESGLFLDSYFSIKDTSGSHSIDYISWQFTFFSTIALDMLGYKPKYDFNFLEPLLNKDGLAKWFRELNWKNFWYSSNQIMFLMYFLSYLKERMNYDADLISDLIQECFDILDSKQDPNTGYWGTDLSNDLYDGMYGAAHIYLFYDYHGKKINHLEKIIDNTLHLQNKNGLFGSKYGGACEDYDAVEILSKISRHTDYKKDDVNKALMKIYKKIGSSQQNNGGFSYYLEEKSLKEKVKKLLDQDRNKQTYSYSGWNKMTCNVFVPDIWGTYFRTLTLATIEADIPSLKKNKFSFYDLPGWGYYSKK